ncbi:MAG: hypothetical protein C0417_03685 [Chlorobiaceae bacterium]|nr:hypothetical protein [Chlorobiaceae bacterium]
MLSGAKHLDFKVFETLHFLPAIRYGGHWQAGVQGDNWRDFLEVSNRYYEYSIRKIHLDINTYFYKMKIEKYPHIIIKIKIWHHSNIQ